MFDVDVGGADGWFDGLLGAPGIAGVVCVLCMVHTASATSAALFNNISFGNLSGSPGCRGSTFCNLWKPQSIVGSFNAKHNKLLESNKFA